MPEEQLKALEARYDHDVLLIVQDAVQGLNAILDRLDAYTRSTASSIKVPFSTPLQDSEESKDEEDQLQP